MIPYIVSIVGIKNFGISSVAFSVSFFFSIIVDFGFYITGVNKLSTEKDSKNISVIITNIIYTKTILFLALLPIVLIIYWYLTGDGLEWRVYLFSLCIPFASILNLSWALQGLHKIKAWSLLTILGQVFYIVMVFLLIHEPSDVIIINLLYGLGLLLSGLASLLYLTKKHSLQFTKIDRVAIAAELKGGYHFFLSNLGNYTALYFLSPLIGFMISYEMAGIYAIIEKIYLIARRPFSIYQTFMLPKISNLVQTTQIRTAKQTIKSTFLFVIIFILAELIVLWIFKRQIIHYFTSLNVELLEKMLLYSLIALIIVIINCPITLFLMAMNRKRELMKISLIAPMFGVIFGYILLSHYGIIGSIFSIIFLELFYSVYLLIEYIKFEKIRKERSSITKL